MSRTFAYARVSTADQTPENQIQEIKLAGFQIEPHRIVTEHVSGSVAASDRKGFQSLLAKMERDDVLIVTKLDRLGRSAIDVRATVDLLAAAGIRVHCLALGGADLTSSAGRMLMGVIASFAEFERDLIVERTQAGLARAKSEGKRLGRPLALSEEEKAQARQMLAAGATVTDVAKMLDVSRATVMRCREAS